MGTARTSSAWRLRLLVADEARRALLDALPTTDPRGVRYLVEVLPALAPTKADQAEARRAWFNALPTAGLEAIPFS